jgi:glucose-6-phosphate isomerase, archaeal
MKIDLKESAGLPVAIERHTGALVLGEGLNVPSVRVRMLHDLDGVWANPVPDDDRMIYQYTSGLWFDKDEAYWKKANVIYGIVVFMPGVFSGEYNKSSGQYHPVMPPNTKATPEIYTVMHGTGHFLLQKATPPYAAIEDAVMVEVQKGESFIVPPDYGHLQINCSKEPLIFSYAVMDGMAGVYEPFRQKKGAVYYEMASKDAGCRFIANANYKPQIPLRTIKAREICQLPLFNKPVTYQQILVNLKELEFLTDPEKFPASAAL